MPTGPHFAQHFKGSALVRDVVIGMAIGLTVLFALGSELSPVASSTNVIVTVGSAAIVAAANAKGFGSYPATSDQEHHQTEERSEFGELNSLRDLEVRDAETIIKGFDLDGEGPRLVVDPIASDRVLGGFHDAVRVWSPASKRCASSVSAAPAPHLAWSADLLPLSASRRCWVNHCAISVISPCPSSHGVEPAFGDEKGTIWIRMHRRALLAPY